MSHKLTPEQKKRIYEWLEEHRFDDETDTSTPELRDKIVAIVEERPDFTKNVTYTEKGEVWGMDAETVAAGKDYAEKPRRIEPLTGEKRVDTDVAFTEVYRKVNELIAAWNEEHGV